MSHNEILVTYQKIYGSYQSVYFTIAKLLRTANRNINSIIGVIFQLQNYHQIAHTWLAKSRKMMPVLSNVQLFYKNELIIYTLEHTNDNHSFENNFN